MNTFKRKLIGRGDFTKAYQVSDTQVEVVTVCPAKECYALFSKGNPFAPTIEKLDYLESGESVYLMPLYAKVRAPKKELNEDCYKIYKALRGITCFGMTYQKYISKVGALGLSEEVTEYLCDLAGDVCNAIDTQDLGFEISPRNIAVGEGGQLIMLDCFFCRKVLAKIQGRK